MHYKFFAAAAAAALMFLAPSPTYADQTHACCASHSAMSDVNVLELLTLDTDIGPAPMAPQTVEVWFTRPTWVGKTILQGRFVIEHDEERMARGEPCTHVYAFDNRDTPMATFHCTHLERERASHNTIVVIPTPNGWNKLTEFQFAGESASHGYPTVR